MTKHGRIIRTDYRVFQWSVYINYERTKKQIAGMEDTNARIEKYLKNRQNYEIKLLDRTVQLAFENVSDAQMFVLAFSDLIDTHGVRFD